MGQNEHEQTTGSGSPLRAVVYVRISDDPEGSERGVDRQEADCRAYAAAHGLEVAAVFRENDTSAFKQNTITLPSGERVRRVIRPQFRAMLKHLSEGQAQVMVAYDLDRAVRDPRDLEDLIDAKVLGEFGVRSVTGSLRLDTDSDVAMARVLVAMANKSSADTARRVARAAKQQALEGAWHGGRAPFGYRAENGVLVIDPVTGPMVVEAMQRVLAGESLYRIRKDWNERGVLTTHGCAWSDRTLKLMLRNPSTKGVREYRPILPDGTRSKTSLMQVKAAWPAIVDEDTWQQVSDVLDARKKARNLHQPGSGAAKRMYPFSGLIRCSACGTAMLHRGPVYQCVQATRGGCHRSIRSTEVSKLVEEAVLATFEQITLNPTKRRAPGGDLTARVGLAATLDADRERLAQLDDDHYDGLIDKAMWVRQRARIAERIEATRREYAAAVPEQHVGPSIDMTTVAAEWEGRTPMWQYQATSLVLQAVLVHAHPADMMTAVPKRRNESTEAFHARRDAHRADVLARRIEFIWRA
ncbi:MULTISPECIES: recombinase family protein [Micrococcales]|uniref:recombinase family protein n=1 Tax=Micrococcales TaxID=85006 RepID=UPI00223B10E6|nr:MULTISPECIES: recombinase family protein [Micrococcales]MCT1874279.1 recombinase family protein [Brevibacterium luteolum]MCT1894018.1 recombinase family protein [Brevibacterium luteolum]MDK7742191.1 recombinase family protein [Helcobacillus massiliensis]WOO93743.1 recombinase family protein [Helcobacillus massiliensis]